jgi:hypothetical protein
MARRSSPLPTRARRNSSCIVIAASAPAVTLGKTIQNPSPSGLTMRPSCAAATRDTKARCSVRRPSRSTSGSARNRTVEPRMSVFMMTVVRRVVMLTSSVVSHLPKQYLPLRKVSSVRRFSSFGGMLLHAAERYVGLRKDLANVSRCET